MRIISASRSPRRQGMEDLSPLQARLMATYMDALSEQADPASKKPPASATPPPPKKPPSPSAAPVQEAKWAKGAGEGALESSKQGSSARSARSDLYSKKMGELLLKGWRMLGDNCPMTGEVPLMQVLFLSLRAGLSSQCLTRRARLTHAQDPKSGRKFSIAVGKFTDEMAVEVCTAAMRGPETCLTCWPICLAGGR